MRNFTLKFALLFIVTIFASCVEKEYITVAGDEKPKDESTYTIMMYGCGGGNLDLPMVTNIREALLAGSTDRVKFTGQVKFSNKFQAYEETAGTQRFIVDSTSENWYTPVEVLDTQLKLYDPQNLTDFINWSKEQCPADEYILLLWNHGSAWVPKYDAPVGRAVIHDDMFDKAALTLEDLVKGIKDSGTKMKMIYYDACLMGMLEIMSGIAECADYAMAASHITPGIGGDYNSLIHHLNNSTNFEEAMKEYCAETVSHWNVDEKPYDLTLVNLSKMDNLLGEIKLFSGYMKEIVQIASKYNEDPGSMTGDEMQIYASFRLVMDNCYMYDANYRSYPFFDLQHFAEIFTYIHNSYTAKLVDASSRLKRAFKDAIVCKQLSNVIAGNLNLSLGLTIIHDQYWEERGYNGTYTNLKFHQVTNWGDWISINPFAPSGRLNPDTVLGNGEAPGEGETPEEGETPGEGGGNEGVDKEIELILEIIRNR